MKNYKRFIFDLDYTLLIPDWSREDDFLRRVIPLEEQEEFFRQKQLILNRYELEFPRYDFNTLSDFFKNYGFSVSEEVISGWMFHNGETIKDEVVDGVIELFKYLKKKNKDIIILTSWFSGTQIPRLKRTGLYDLESFELAIGNINKEDCIMIGDSIKSDKLGAENAGIDYYIVDEEHSIKDFLYMLMDSNGKTSSSSEKPKQNIKTY